MIVSLFWNREQRRLRMFWRLACFVILVIIFSIPTMLLGRLIGITAASGLAVIAAVWLGGRWLDRRAFTEFGMRPDRAWWSDFWFGLLLGVVMVSFMFAVQYGLGWITVHDILQPAPDGGSLILGFLFAILFVIVVGLNEELLVRGYILRNLHEGWLGLPGTLAPCAALVFSSAIFGLLHVPNPNASLVSTVNITLAGLLLGIPYLLTNRLAISIGLHITWNFTLGVIYGLPVSGRHMDAPHLLATSQSGPDTWTGGAFGPEAGLVGLAAMVIGFLLIFVWVRYKEGVIRIHPEFMQLPEKVRKQGEPLQAPAGDADGEMVEADPPGPA